MLILGSRITNTAVMSLQTGTKIGQAVRPIIDPANLRVFAYEVQGPLLTVQPSFLRTNDIREIGPLGMIVDSSDELVGLEDIIKLKELYELGFPLVGMAVIDDARRKLGKVDDYTLETGDFFIQQMSVKHGVIRGLTNTGLLIHRSQIVEINDKSIVVKSNKAVAPTPERAPLLDYVNPFREQSPQPEQAKTN